MPTPIPTPHHIFLPDLDSHRLCRRTQAAHRPMRMTPTGGHRARMARGPPGRRDAVRVFRDPIRVEEEPRVTNQSSRDVRRTPDRPNRGKPPPDARVQAATSPPIEPLRPPE